MSIETRFPACLPQWTLKAKARVCQWTVGFLQERLVQDLLELIPNLFGSEGLSIVFTRPTRFAKPSPMGWLSLNASLNLMAAVSLIAVRKRNYFSPSTAF